MHCRQRFFWAITLGLCGVAGAGRADLIVRKDGTTIEGRILEQVPDKPCKTCVAQKNIRCEWCGGSGMVGAAGCPVCKAIGRITCPTCRGTGVKGGTLLVLTRGNIRLRVIRANIETIKRQAIDEKTFLLPKEYYRKRAAEISPDDARAHYELAVWCLKKSRLLDEAERHFHQAGRDSSYREKAQVYLKRIERDRERSARKDLSRALKALQSKDNDAGHKALESFRKRHAATQLARSERLQRAVIEEVDPKLGLEYGRTIGAILDAIRRQQLIRCEQCGGAKRVPCPTCRGTGLGVCPTCAGTKKVDCRICLGRRWRSCPVCRGTGKVHDKVTLEVICPKCRGSGDVWCDVCERKGSVNCPTCRGRGVASKRCPTCSGGGAVTCSKCGGSGKRPVDQFIWGPVPVHKPTGLTVRSSEQTAPVWQGRYRGGVITIVPSDVVHGGRLASTLAEILGHGYRYLLVCIDNRDGSRQIELSPRDKSVRLVMAGHRQVEIVDLSGKGDVLRADAKFAKIARQFEHLRILPGVIENAVVALPAGTDLSQVKAVYWGVDEPWPLNSFFLGQEEIREIQKTRRVE